MKDFMLNNFQTTVPNSIWKFDDNRTRTGTTYGNFNTNSPYMYIKHIKYTCTTGVPMQGFLLGGGKGTLAPP